MNDLLDFWFADGPDTWRDLWFRRDDAFDAALRARFGTLAAPDDWAATPRGALALCLALDQLPRNLHRGTPAAFASDERARAIASHAVLGLRFDLALTPTERLFLYLPFEHSEAMADQDLSVALFEGLRDLPLHADPMRGTIIHAWKHRAVIERFGRFPHRNQALDRQSTNAEVAYLAQPGAGF